MPGDRPAPEAYPNPSDDDIVEWLPETPADRRIQYGDGPLRFGDLRLPDADRPGGHPVVVLVHGGVWQSKWTHDHAQPLAAAFADAGFAVWTLEYRRLGNEGGGWPGTFADVAAGLDHLRDLADDYPLDLDRVVTVGHSAGGHLAAWLAARHRIPEGAALHAPDPLPVRGTVSLAGALDLERYDELKPDVIPELLGFRDDDDAEPAARYATASPRHLLPLGVPQEVIVGSEDGEHLREIADAYVDAATDAGDDVRFTRLEGANHFDVIDPDGPAWPLVRDRVRSLVAEP